MVFDGSIQKCNFALLLVSNLKSMVWGIPNLSIPAVICKGNLTFCRVLIIRRLYRLEGLMLRVKNKY